MKGELGTFFPFIALYTAGVMVWCISSIMRGLKRRTSSLELRNVLESDKVSATNLALIRLLMGAFEFYVLVKRAMAEPFQLCSGEGERKNCVPYGGSYLFSTFTVWCFTAQAFYLTLSGLMGLSKRRLYLSQSVPSNTSNASTTPSKAVSREPQSQSSLREGAKKRNAAAGKNANESYISGSSTLVLSFWITHQVMLVLAWFIFLVVWLVLIPSIEMQLARDPLNEKGLVGRRVMWSAAGLIMHNFNAVAMSIDAYLSQMHLEKEHRYFALLFVGCYLIFANFFHYYTGVWYYFFLDPEKPLCLVAIPVTASAVLYLYGALAHLKDVNVEGLSGLASGVEGGVQGVSRSGGGEQSSGHYDTASVIDLLLGGGDVTNNSPPTRKARNRSPSAAKSQTARASTAESRYPHSETPRAIMTGGLACASVTGGRVSARNKSVSRQNALFDRSKSASHQGFSSDSVTETVMFVEIDQNSGPDYYKTLGDYSKLFNHEYMRYT